jgi:4-oxalocrotonate tautomerase
MPIVQVSVWEGLAPDNKKKIVEEITKVFEDIGVPKEEIRIVIYEAPKSNWATGGELHSERYAHSLLTEEKVESVDESPPLKMQDIVPSPSVANSISKTPIQNKEFNEAVFRVEELKTHNTEDVKTHNAEELKPLGETLILESERGTRLYQDRLIHEGKLYPISEMKRASTKAGFIHSLLEILFKDGKLQSFYVGNVPNMPLINMANSNSNGSKIDHVSNDFKEAAEQWASAINKLISLSNK